MVLFAIGYTLGVWLLQQQASLPELSGTWLWAFLLALLPVALAIPSRLLLLRALRMLLLGTLALCLGYSGAAWMASQRLAVSLPQEWQGRDIELIGVVAELPRRHEHGQRFIFDVERTLTPRASVPHHIYLSTYDEQQTRAPVLHAGERWQLTVRLKRPHGSSDPYGFDFEWWALENDIRAVGYINNKAGNTRLDELSNGIGYRIETWREAVRDRIDAALAGAAYAGVLNALAIGDQGSIPQNQWQAFTRTGVNHLMSISGLHITMLASLGFILTYWLWRHSVRLTLFLPARKAAALAALLVALGYALLSGFAVPAQRTVYMVGAVACALWLNRNFSLSQMLAIALLGVLIPDPWAVLSPGFWLSFGAVALILYVTAHRMQPSHWLAEYGKVQWAMMIGLVPLLLGLFQQVSMVAPVANAVAIPLVSLVVVPLTLAGAVLPFDTPLWLAHTMMGWTMAFLQWLNVLPLAVWTQHAPVPWSIVAGMLGVLLILLPRGFPARWLGWLMLLPMFLNTPQPPRQGAVRLVIFDVGQGLSVLVRTSNHTLLYDTGPDFSGESDSGNRILVPNLRAMGIARLDGLMLTHDDTDHTGGAASLMQAIPVSWVSSSLPDDNVLLQPIADRRRCADGQSWHWDGVDFEILHPDNASHDQEDISKNNRGCVLRIGIGSKHILLTADIEMEAEHRLLEKHKDKLPADLLVVPHHGSRTSSTTEFVAAVHPRQAVFTVGYLNRFGHPRPDVVRRYRNIGSGIARSDEDGAVIVEASPESLMMERYRKSHHRYWMDVTASVKDVSH